jgi:transketolase
MCSILNGMVLSKIRAYGATFLIFSDYARPPMRLASLMEIPVIYVFTHDSIGLGEDGPTHQSIEQLIGLRSVPGFIMLRPADANEVTEAWKLIMQTTHHPAALALTRQAIPTFDRGKYASAAGVAKGAYVLADARPTGADPELILMGTGSEVQLCLAAYEQLSAEGRRVRVVSMPSWEIFEQQTAEYRESVLPSRVTARISVEAGSTMGWSRYVGPAGKSIGMTTFGASAPAKDVFKKFGFTPENVIAVAKDLLATTKR